MLHVCGSGCTMAWLVVRSVCVQLRYVALRVAKGKGGGHGQGGLASCIRSGVVCSVPHVFAPVVVIRVISAVAP
jgi:hypothetical protein